MFIINVHFFLVLPCYYLPILNRVNTRTAVLSLPLRLLASSRIISHLHHLISLNNIKLAILIKVKFEGVLSVGVKIEPVVYMSGG